MWDSTTAWHLEETLRIGAVEGDGPDVFGGVSAVQVDGRGHVYVLESQADEIRVFDAGGGYIRTIGRRGGGPGEFENPVGMDWDSRGRLWVVDVRNGRYSAFDSSGAYVTQRPRLAGFYAVPWPGGFGPEGRLLDIGLDPPDKPILVRYDSAGVPVDTVRVPHFEGDVFSIPQRVSVAVPFAPFLVWRLDRRGFIWSMVTSEYRIVQQNLAGDTVRVIEKVFHPLPVTAEDEEEAIESLDWFRREGGRIDRSRIPGAKPAIIRQGILVDHSGNLWVRPVVPEALRLRVFDVFDPEGRYLGRAISAVPIQSSPLPTFTADAVYGVSVDELEVPYVVRLDIRR